MPGCRYHLAATYSVSTSTLSFYVNGALVKTGTTTSCPTNQGVFTYLTLGYSSSSGVYLDGLLSDFRLYASTLRSVYARPCDAACNWAAGSRSLAPLREGQCYSQGLDY